MVWVAVVLMGVILQNHANAAIHITNYDRHVVKMQFTQLQNRSGVAILSCNDLLLNPSIWCQDILLPMFLLLVAHVQGIRCLLEVCSGLKSMSLCSNHLRFMYDW